MKEHDFGKYLQGQGLSAHGVSARLSWCKRVERDFGVDLEDIARSESEMQKIRRAVYDNERYTWRQRRNFPNGLKKYFEFVNSHELPRLTRSNL